MQIVKIDFFYRPGKSITHELYAYLRVTNILCEITRFHEKINFSGVISCF
jgi:hypothetical protein